MFCAAWSQYGKIQVFNSYLEYHSQIGALQDEQSTGFRERYHFFMNATDTNKKNKTRKAFRQTSLSSDE